MRRFVLSTVAAVATAAVAGSARADFVIDNFAIPGTITSTPLAAGVGAQYQAVDTLPLAGNSLTRQVTVTQTADALAVGGNLTPGHTTAYLGGGLFSLATAAGTTAFADLAYQPTTALNLSGAGTAVQLTFSSADLSTPFSVRLVSGTGATQAIATQTGSVNSSSIGTFSVPITGFGGVDLSNITGIEVLLNVNTTTGASTPSADFTLTNLSVTTPTPPNSVPAPAAALLGLFAVPALALRRRVVG